MGSLRLCESPNRFGWLKSRMAKARSYSDQVAHELLPQVEILRAVQRKHAYPLFMAIGRVAVAAEGSRSNYLLDRVLSSYHLLNAPGSSSASSLDDSFVFGD